MKYLPIACFLLALSYSFFAEEVMRISGRIWWDYSATVQDTQGNIVSHEGIDVTAEGLEYTPSPEVVSLTQESQGWDPIWLVLDPRYSTWGRNGECYRS